MRARRPTLGCAAVLLAATLLPLAALAALWMIGNGNHRSVAQRLRSPDGRFEARVQNDVRGSIQPIEWVVFVKPAATRSDDPASSFAVADVRGEDGWRAVGIGWRGGALELRRTSGAVLPVRRPLRLRAAARAPVAIRLIDERARGHL